MGVGRRVGEAEGLERNDAGSGMMRRLLGERDDS